MSMDCNSGFEDLTYYYVGGGKFYRRSSRISQGYYKCVPAHRLAIFRYDSVHMLKQSYNLARFYIDVHVIESRSCWQTRNGHDISTNGVEKSSPDAATNFSYKNAETGWYTFCLCVATERILRFRNTNRQVSKTATLILRHLLLCQLRKVDSICPINLFADGLHLLADGQLQIVQIPEVLRLARLARRHNRPSQSLGTLPALGPVVRDHGVERPRREAGRAHRFHFRGRIEFELIDGDHHLHAELFGVLDVFHEVAASGLDERYVFFRVLGREGFAGGDWRSASVHF
mmetsp:Transcript_29075/g.60573  ORF Transcript_29075/g.60573 Transcript_29075/m.60573 type:complete len:287 (-) Transcript_29075:1441-2301(-)